MFKHTKYLDKIVEDFTPRQQDKKPLKKISNWGKRKSLPMRSKGHSQREKRPPEVSAFQGPSEKLSLKQACIYKIDKIKSTCLLKVRRIADHLKFFSEKWILITKSKFVLNCIKGYKIRFKSRLCKR